MPANFTDKRLAALKPARHRYERQDSGVPGLICRVSPSGYKTMSLYVRYPGHNNPTRRTIGEFGRITVDDARRTAREWLALIERAIDPNEEQQRQLREQRAARSNLFADVAEAYLVERTNRRAVLDARETRRVLIKAWGPRPVNSITPRDVRLLIEEVKARAPYEAKNAWTHASSIFKWCVHQELIDASPCASLDKRLLFRGSGIAPRERVLDDTEIAAMWRASGRLGPPLGPFYRLLLLSAVRLSELAEARWSELHPELRKLLRDAKGERINWAEVDDTIKLWTVPKTRFKSNSEHSVPLTDDALAIIETLPRFQGCDFLFTFDGKVPINSFSAAKAKLDARMLRLLRALARQRGDDPKQVKLENWKNHDLRRVVRSNLAALAIPEHIAEQALGHGRTGLARIYDRHRYVEEVRSALGQWAGRLRAITSPPPKPAPQRPKVVKFRRRA